MNILFSIEHPAHVHLFKNLIWELQKTEKVVVVAFEKDITIDLLNHYGIKHINLKSYGKSIIAKGLKMPIMSLKLAYLSLKFKIDILIGVSIFAAQAGFLTRKKSYIFTDTEHAKEQIALFKPFATKIFTPDCFLDDLGPKQVRYPGYHELAYLHPNRFTPNPEVLKEIGLTEQDKFFIVRFVSWEATHDVGQKGLSIEDKRKLIETLKPHGKIIISSERELPAEFEEYRMSICPTKMHDLLYYATMYIGEGGTMASEAACLGTYSIYINSLPAMGYIKEEIEKYFLIYKSTKLFFIINKIKEINFENIKIESKIKFNQLIKDKIDVTGWMINQIILERKSEEQGFI